MHLKNKKEGTLIKLEGWYVWKNPIDKEGIIS